MKKRLFLFAAFFVLIGSFVYAADLKKDIVGKWEFDLGGGYMATTEYKANGTFDQVMTGMTISGTYTVQGQKITTAVKDKKTVFTVEKSDATSMTLKRDADGRIVVYEKKYNKDNAHVITKEEVDKKKTNIVNEDMKAVDDFNDHMKSADRDLFYSVKYGDYSAMVLAINNGANVNARNYHGQTPLMIVAQSGADQMVKYLIEHKADVNATILKTNMTALMAASIGGKTSVVQLPIAYGANVNVKNYIGFTAYNMAEFNKHTDVMLLLKLAGAK